MLIDRSISDKISKLSNLWRDQEIMVLTASKILQLILDPNMHSETHSAIIISNMKKSNGNDAAIKC
jgi:hypothetical protein